MSLKSAFSTQILHARSERRLTQAQVAEAVCISVRWYQKIEKGIALPNSEILLRLILFLQLDVEVRRDLSRVFSSKIRWLHPSGNHYKPPIFV